MWERVLYVIQDKMVIICTALSFLVPYGVNWINTKMHQVGDPPWKQDEDK